MQQMQQTASVGAVGVPGVGPGSMASALSNQPGLLPPGMPGLATPGLSPVQVGTCSGVLASHSQMTWLIITVPQLTCNMPVLVEYANVQVASQVRTIATELGSR